MKALFMVLLSMLHETENVTEALMYENFSKIKFETEDGTYSISISKEKENGDL